MAVRSLSPPSSAASGAVNDRAHQNGDDEHEADDDDGTVSLYAGKSKAILQCLYEDEPECRADDRAAPAEDARAAEHHPGDDVEFEPGTHVGARGGDARHEDDCRKCCEKTGAGVNQKFRCVDSYAGIARRHLIGAGSV